MKSARIYTLSFAVLFLIWFTLQLCHRCTSKFVKNRERGCLAVQSAAEVDEKPHTMVLYTFSYTNPEYLINLHYFVKHGIKSGDGCDYLIIIQDNKFNSSIYLPELPDNARYVYHQNTCFDWGAVDWAFNNGLVDPKKYLWFIFMNSSVRGPFIPSYWPGSIHWSQALISRLNSDVKLVGPTISCESCWQGGDSTKQRRSNPHVQSMVIATDREGLSVMMRDGNIFKCYDSLWDTIYYSEVGSSRAILDAGFTIDSLMLRYKNVNWRNRSNWKCNGELNPYAEYAYDGVWLNPLEVMFVKVKDFMIDLGWSSAILASKYSSWAHQTDINPNHYLENRIAYRSDKISRMERRGSSCFDTNFYQSHSPDLSHLHGEELWRHFVHDGQFEGRPVKFSCKTNLFGVGQNKIIFE